MRAAAMFGLDSSEKDLEPFRTDSSIEWIIGAPASSSDADAILIFGGDGTIHRHLAQLVQLQLPVLVVPCGSGNDFARALHSTNKKTSLSAWKKFCSGACNVRSIDLGVIKPISDVHASASQYFCSVGGVGLDTAAARFANRMPRWLRARGGYPLSLLLAVFRYETVPMRVSIVGPNNPKHIIPGGEAPLVLAVFANTPAYGGGMEIAPRAQFDDGKLDICIVHEINKFKLLLLFPTVYFGRHLGIPGVEYMQTSWLKIESESPVDVYADGEYVDQTPVEVSVTRNALRVIHP